MNGLYEQLRQEIIDDGGGGSDLAVSRIVKIFEDAGYKGSTAHKEVLNRMKLTMLKAAANYVMERMDNDFMVRDICEPEQFKLFNNFQKLRYHGLVTPMRDHNGKRIKGRWLITRNGWSFLRGQLQLPKYVLVKNNSIDSRSDVLAGLKDIYYAEEYIETHFEYFDDDNKPVGLRPAFPRENKQVAML